MTTTHIRDVFRAAHFKFRLDKLGGLDRPPSAPDPAANKHRRQEPNETAAAGAGDLL